MSITRCAEYVLPLTGPTSTSSSIVGIADTGTTLIYLPAAVVKAYYADVSGATVSPICLCGVIPHGL